MTTTRLSDEALLRAIRIVAVLFEHPGRLRPLARDLDMSQRTVLARLRQLEAAGLAVQQDDRSWLLTDDGRERLMPLIDAWRQVA